METSSEMGPPSARAMRADHGIDWEYVDARRHPVTLVSRPAYEGWMLTLFGAMLVGLLGLLGWAGYALSTVKAELRQLQAQVAQWEPQRTVGEAEPEAMAPRLDVMDQRLDVLESWTRDTAPRLTTLEQRPPERVAKPPAPTAPPALPPASDLPRPATTAPRTPQDHQASRDMRQQAAMGRLGAPVPDSFGTWRAWHPAWELRWMRVQGRGQTPVSLYHITSKSDPGQRYTSYWDPDRRTWQPWTRW